MMGTVLVGAPSLAVVLGLRRTGRRCRGRSSRWRWGSLLVDAASASTTTAWRSSAHRPRPAVARRPGRLAPTTGAGGRRRRRVLVGFAEGLGAAKTFARREHYEIDTNRELLGLGGANLASGLSSGMVVNGIALEDRGQRLRGAHTQLSGLVVAVLVVTLLLLTGLFEQLPRRRSPPSSSRRSSSSTSRRSPSVRDLRRPAPGPLPRRSTRTSWPRSPRCSACSSSTRCPGCSSASGLAAPAALPRLAAARRRARPGRGAAGRGGTSRRHGLRRRPTGIAVLRVEGGLFFANADTVRARILAAAGEAAARWCWTPRPCRPRRDRGRDARRARRGPGARGVRS